MGRNKKIIISVSNDITNDQRVLRIARFLQKQNFEVVLLGRKLPDSVKTDHLPFCVHRFSLLFNKGPMFYAALNFRIFFYLIFHRSEALLSNDLDTLGANYFASKFKRKCTLYYDSHELFCEVPELQNSPRKKRIWERLEKFIFPKLKKVYTVNKSIADHYSKKYNVPVRVVRNITEFPKIDNVKSRNELGLPDDKFIVIIQGSGINVDRGNEEVVEAFQLLNDNFHLLIAGSGDVIPKLKTRVKELKIDNKVSFKDKMPYPELLQHTLNCNLGISLDKATNLNYTYSLPNKLFDFIHCEIPVLASELPEIKNIVTSYHIGAICPDHSPKTIASSIEKIYSEKENYLKLKSNCAKAKTELNWENEQKVLEEIFLK